MLISKQLYNKDLTGLMALVQRYHYMGLWPTDIATLSCFGKIKLCSGFLNSHILCKQELTGRIRVAQKLTDQGWAAVAKDGFLARMSPRWSHIFPRWQLQLLLPLLWPALPPKTMPLQRLRQYSLGSRLHCSLLCRCFPQQVRTKVYIWSTFSASLSQAHLD